MKADEYEYCFYYDFSDRPPCAASEKTLNGAYKCLALNDTEFGDRDCPFYREETKDE